MKMRDPSEAASEAVRYFVRAGMFLILAIGIVVSGTETTHIEAAGLALVSALGLAAFGYKRRT
jgi:TRAP-type C4-dicarboxylate transport system permease large subunit